MELVTNNGGRVETDSLRVALKFGKQHKDVLESIRELTTAENSAVLRMFTETTYLNEQNKKQPMFTMNRDGFSLLVMGFTGKKALQFKLDFISAFGQMEEQLKQLQFNPGVNFNLPTTLPAALRQLAEKYESEEKLISQNNTLLIQQEGLKIQNQAQAKALIESASKVEFHDKVLDTPDLFTISTIAAELGFRSPSALNTYLNTKGVLKRVGGVWLLTANFVGMGYTGPKTHTHTDKSGVQHSTILTCWTQKGREFIHRFYSANPPGGSVRVLKPFINTPPKGGKSAVLQ
ncbi:Rha family transcriptional regulator [Dyadobacter sp. 3J3]|uniref:Rha family transcriptional regulator n=1 Tax=Dyadobacter sp. 3J3 TaxID=2606600 RepID=UPI0013569E4A|nr:phage regulatory protein/antirepressor Ant [Dyadobacter sp. 3J3]